VSELVSPELTDPATTPRRGSGSVVGEDAWRPTPALARSVVVSGVGLALALLFGDAVLVVLVAPLALCAAIGLRYRPHGAPSARPMLEHTLLHEGQGTGSVLRVTRTAEVEQLTRVMADMPYVALDPVGGCVARLLPDGVGGGQPDPGRIDVSPRRWGRLEVGEERYSFTSRWAGFRWGPVFEGSRPLTVLPTSQRFDSHTGMPQPLGLVGAHRSRRAGSGTEFASIRPFAVGDRLRRVHWPVSLRTGQLHVVSTLAEEDVGVLLLVDALADVGRSGGVEGPPSSLDVGVRAATALAEHYSRSGDRIGLRVVGGDGPSLGFGSGQRHLRRLNGQLARVRPGTPRDLPEEGLPLGVGAGTVVMVLSPMLHPAIAGTAVQLTRRGLPLLVIDTLPESAAALLHPVAGADPELAALAWRMRLLDREVLLAQLAGTGCPVVRWRGPGTLDEVLHRLSRRAQAPRVRVR
jgi:uncharacterized protein (DUF58 family)